MLPLEEFPFFESRRICCEIGLWDALLNRDCEGEAIEKATQCPFHTPVIGSWAPNWKSDSASLYHLSDWTKVVKDEVISLKAKSVTRGTTREVTNLRSSHHEVKTALPLPLTLGHRIFSHEARWDGFTSTGDFTPYSGYWEWTELVLGRSREILEKAGLRDAVVASLFVYDRCRPMVRAFCEAWCPGTNSLHTARGEVSIGLWDLRSLGGLPITGEFYDEVTPGKDEITELDEKSDVLPFGCRFLFHAYHMVKCVDFALCLSQQQCSDRATILKA